MTRPLIVADENIPGIVELFGELGDVRTVQGRAMTPAQVRDADILLVRSVTSVDGRLLDGSRVRWVGTATIGVDHLDIPYLQGRGIDFASAPGSNADSVVEYVLAALAGTGAMWARLLAGQARVAVIGVGNVGERLMRRLLRLGIETVGCDPLRSGPPDLRLVTLEAALQSSVVCLHTPLTRAGPAPTWHLLGERELATLPRGALLLNAGRGPVLDNAALLRSRDDLWLALDVWEHEPAIDRRLLERVALGTPHIAGYSLDGKIAGARQLLRACCHRFGWVEPVQRAPAAPRPWVEVAAGLPDAELIRRVLHGVYDPWADDRRLRAAVRGIGDEAVGTAFDALRRSYPVRRELAVAELGGVETLCWRQRKLLTSLGIPLASRSTAEPGAGMPAGRDLPSLP